MTDIEETVDDAAEEVGDDLHQLVKALTDRVDALESTIAGMSQGLNATPPAATTEQEVGVNSQGAEAHTEQEVDDDPYMLERAPIRKHTLFRRIIG